MEIEIDELVSSVHAVDGEAPLSPAAMAEIVRVVSAAVRRDLAHDKALRRERMLGGDDDSSTRFAKGA